MYNAGFSFGISQSFGINEGKKPRSEPSLADIS